MYSSYAKLGKNCIEQNIAYTSNEKFINPIYFEPFTKVNIPKNIKNKNNNIQTSSCKSCGF